VIAEARILAAADGGKVKRTERLSVFLHMPDPQNHDSFGLNFVPELEIPDQKIADITRKILRARTSGLGELRRKFSCG